MALCPVHCLLTCSTLSAHIPGKSPPHPLSPGTPHSPPAPGAPGQALNLEHYEIPARLPSQGTKLSPGDLTRVPRQPAGSLCWCWQDPLPRAAPEKNSEESLALSSWRFYCLRLEEGQGQ